MQLAAVAGGPMLDMRALGVVPGSGFTSGGGGPPPVLTTLGAIVGNRIKFPTTSGTVANLVTSQIAHTAPAAGAISALKFTDVWYFLNPSFGFSVLAATLTIKKWVEYPRGTFTPVTWAASATGTISTTVRNLTSDACPVSIPAGAAWWEHTMNAGASATFALRENSATAAALGVLDAKYTAADVNTPASQLAGEASAAAFGSALITGTIAAPGYKSPYIVAGDSIAWAQGDITSVGVSGSSGYLGRIFDAQGLSYGMFAKPGISMSNFVTMYSAGSATLNPFVALVNAVTNLKVILQAGVNDLRLGRTQSQFLADCQTVQSFFPGKAVGQMTLTPRSTSTDVWATEVNQTAQTDGNWAAEPATNDAIRAVPAGVSAVYEAADTAMTARNSGIWKSSPTVAFVPTLDGTHPTSLLAAYLAANTTLVLP